MHLYNFHQRIIDFAIDQWIPPIGTANKGYLYHYQIKFIHD